MNKEKKEEGLLGFNWEGDEENFFDIEETKPKEVVEEEKENEEREVIEEEEKESFFEVPEEKKKEEGEEKPSETVNIYTDLYKDLKDQGIFKHVEIEEDEEIDTDRLFELQQEEYEAEVSARLNSWANEELDDDARAFIKFKRDGGKTEDFLKTYSSSTELPIGDITEESHQDKVIRYQLKEEGWDAEEIEDRLKYFSETGKKEKIAKKYDQKIKLQDDKNKEIILKQAEKQKQTSLKQENEFKNNIKGVLEETEEIKGVKITQKDKNSLYNFLTKKSYKLSDSRTVTGFQKKLSETFQDPSKMLLLAKLISSDFDMKDFEKATITKKTRKIKSNLEQRKNLRPSSSGSSLGENRLADIFN